MRGTRQLNLKHYQAVLTANTQELGNCLTPKCAKVSYVMRPAWAIYSRRFLSASRFFSASTDNDVCNRSMVKS